MACRLAQQTVQLRVFERCAQAAADHQHVQVIQGVALKACGIDLQPQVADHPFCAQ
ncbi:hypothetical protein D3C75_1080690 [compost metagenome]